MEDFDERRLRRSGGPAGAERRRLTNPYSDSFSSLAYIATALDATGGLRYLAFQVALRAKSGNQLYLFLYSFFFLSGAVIGNDPIILSGTPFLAYLTRVSGITPPTAWIYAQFLAANVSSAILVSSVSAACLRARLGRLTLASLEPNECPRCRCECVLCGNVDQAE